MATWTSTESAWSTEDWPHVKFQAVFNGSITGTTFTGSITIKAAMQYGDAQWGNPWDFVIYKGTSTSGTRIGSVRNSEAHSGTGWYSSTINNATVSGLPTSGNTSFYITLTDPYSSPGRAGGVSVSFGTLAQKPTLSALTISSIARTSSIASFTVTSDGGATVTSQAIKASTTSGDYSNPKATISSNTGTLSELTANTKYYVRGEATNTAGTGYTTESNFTTTGNAPTVSASVQRKKTSAVFTITKSFDDNASLASTNPRKIEYGTSTSYGSTVYPTNDSYTLTGLATTTKYYYRVTITDNWGRSGTATGNFTTGVDNPVITDTTPIPSYTSVTLSPTVTYGEGASFGKIVCHYGIGTKDQTYESTVYPAVITGLKSHTTYTFDYTLYDNEGRPSNTPGGNFLTKNSKPFDVTLVPHQITDSIATIGIRYSIYPEEWSTAGSITVTGSGYNQTQNLVISGDPPCAQPATFSGLSPKTTYTVSGSITNASGTTFPSNITFTTPPLAPNIGSVTIQSNGTTGININVTASGGSGDTLQYRFSSDGGTTWTGLQTGSTKSYTGLTAGNTYNVCLEVRNGDRFVYEYYTITLPTSSSTTTKGLIQYRQDGWWTNVKKVYIAKYSKWLSK